MPLQVIVYYFGYCVALILYKDMGRIFFIPMLFNLWFNLLITFQVYKHVDFRWLMAIHGLLWFIWVITLIQVKRSKFDTTVALVLLLVAFFFGIWPNLKNEPSAYSAMIELCTRISTMWYTVVFVVVAAVFFRSTIVAKIKKEFVDILTNPRKRFLIPIGVFAGIIGITPILSGTIPEVLIKQRFNIGSHVLVWGWVAFELPFYIAYERMKRKQ